MIVNIIKDQGGCSNANIIIGIDGVMIKVELPDGHLIEDSTVVYSVEADGKGWRYAYEDATAFEVKHEDDKRYVACEHCESLTDQKKIPEGTEAMRCWKCGKIMSVQWVAVTKDV